MQDVVIVGAGPAGLRAGARLAASGFQTTLVEEHTSVGEPVHCTGVLAADAFTEFHLPRRSILNELTTAQFWSPAGRQVTYAAGSVEAVVVDRRAFDQDLLGEAEHAGLVVRRGARVSSVDVKAHEVVVKAGDAELRARACVLACGANYSLHRQLGLGMPQLFLHTAQLEVPAALNGDVELHFGNAIAPKGFGWAVPVVRDGQRSVRVGVMCDDDAPAYFEKLCMRLGTRWGIHEARLRKPRQKILPLAPISRTYGDRFVAIGDAAGLVKPTTGGGIYYSLVSADIAASILSQALAADDLRAERLEPYEREWQDRLAKEFQAQLMLRVAAQKMTDEDIEDLFELARTDGVMPIVRRTASFNKHRELIVALMKHPPVRQLLLRRMAF